MYAYKFVKWGVGGGGALHSGGWLLITYRYILIKPNHIGMGMQGGYLNSNWCGNQNILQITACVSSFLPELCSHNNKKLIRLPGAELLEKYMYDRESES